MVAKRFFYVCAGLFLLVLAFHLAAPGAAAQPPTPPPQFVLQWGTDGTGPGQFSAAHGIAVAPNNTVYVTDANRLQQFTPTGEFIRDVLISCGPSPGQLCGPRGIAIDANGDIYIATGRNIVAVFDAAGTFLRAVTWNPQRGGWDPHGIAIDGDHLYVTDRSFSVAKFTKAGAFVAEWGPYGPGDVTNWDPWGIAVDANGHVWVTDSEMQAVHVYDPDGIPLAHFNAPCYGGTGNFLTGVGVDGSGRVFLKSGSSSVVVITVDGTCVTYWEETDAGVGALMGSGWFAFGSDDSIYLLDSLNHRVLKYSWAPVTGAARESFGALKSRYRGDRGAAQPTQDR